MTSWYCRELNWLKNFPLLYEIGIGVVLLALSKAHHPHGTHHCITMKNSVRRMMITTKTQEIIAFVNSPSLSINAKDFFHVIHHRLIKMQPATESRLGECSEIQTWASFSQTLRYYNFCVDLLVIYHAKAVCFRSSLFTNKKHFADCITLSHSFIHSINNH